MLLIAQPKSASTSLLLTLSEISKMGYIQGTGNKKDKKCEGYVEIQKCHSIMGRKTKNMIIRIASDKNRIYREHLLPIEDHVNILNKLKFPFVVLLRKPEDSHNSYCRMFDKNGNEWTDRKKLLQDLQLFHNTYLFLSCSIKNMLIIFYRDLILNYDEAIKRIMDHYGMKGKIIPLKKIKYTGIGDKRLCC